MLSLGSARLFKEALKENRQRFVFNSFSSLYGCREEMQRFTDSQQEDRKQVRLHSLIMQISSALFAGLGMRTGCSAPLPLGSSSKIFICFFLRCRQGWLGVNNRGKASPATATDEVRHRRNQSAPRLQTGVLGLEDQQPTCVMTTKAVAAAFCRPRDRMK